MTLKDIKVNLTYNSGDNNLCEEFYLPCLRASIRYDRAVGFFTSGILGLISQGLNEFLLNNGNIRLICSPNLTKEDIEAINKGYEERERVFEQALVKEIDKIPSGIINNSLNCLSWLISNKKMDIRIALPKTIDWESFGIYHEKIGIFYDDKANIIAFSGSQNETASGILFNYESFDVYRSWIECERCEIKVRHFNKLWSNQAIGVDVMEFPEAAKRRVIEKIIPQEYIYDGQKHVYVASVRKKSCKSFFKELWLFQQEAINKWEENNFKGILSMATGTGKTRTAIGGIIKLKDHINKVFTAIVCPQNSILNQWKDEIDEIDLFSNSVIADSTNNNWDNELANSVIDYNNDIINNCVVLTTYNTFSADKFTRILSNIREGMLIVADEVHWSGAFTFSKGLLQNYNFRLGLSATPKRYMDEEGTDEIEKFFEKVVFEFPLSRALNEINPITGETFLCPYNYYPIFVELDAHEIKEYLELSEIINLQYAKEKDKEKNSEYFQRLCERRQKIVVNATNKFAAISTLIESIFPIKYALFYCSPEQIDKTQDILNSKSIINHRFTGVESTIPQKQYEGLSERDYILDNFEKGNYDALVAMKCLDEGINILRAEKGFFLASSGNPKQFIQRRGRLLRRHQDKRLAHIYDIFVVPYLDKKNANKASETLRKILRSELIRSEEFAEIAQNKLEAKNTLFKIKSLYDFNW